MYAPMNSMNVPSTRSPPNIVVDGHQHTSGSSRKHKLASNERIETQDSIQKDPTLSPRTKAIRKLVKHINTTIEAKGTVPQTSVDFYKVERVLGKGAFGKVNLALHILTQSMCAIKSISKTHIAEDSQIRKVKQEVMILKRTAHQNIVQLYEYFETQKHILFVIELAAGGDLLNYVRKRRQLKEDVAKSVFKQIIDALAYCHSKQILHRDIKLDNILLDINGEIKICDFGVSKIVRPGETMTEQCGTPAYIAPEILKDEGYEGFAVDIWSAGVVLYAMLYGAVPFKANDLAELQRHIIASEYTL
jgi:serine/threonine protein kinase